MRACAVGVALALLMASPAAAQSLHSLFSTSPPDAAPANPWRVAWSHATALPEEAVTSSRPLFLRAVQQAADPQQPLHPAAIEHSEAYQTRAKIHKIASFATLPLFAAEVWLGQSIYNTPSDSQKSAHIVVGTGIIGLFGVNTVTGAWNLFGEGWHDPHGRRLRVAHGLLMMASDAGFVATSMTGPGGHNRTGATFDADKATHRTIALTSIGLGTAGYLLMLFGNR